jgi:tetratricopeptide (TPR) repeat protein
MSLDEKLRRLGAYVAGQHDASRNTEADLRRIHDALPDARRAPPARFIRHSWRFAAGFAAAFLAWQAHRGYQVRICRQSAPPSGGIWGEDVKAHVRSAFLGSGVSYAGPTYERVASLLDRYATALGAKRAEACELPRGERSAPIAALREQCLDRRTRELSTLATLFSNPLEPTVIEHAVEAAVGLGDPASCSDPAALAEAIRPPEDAKLRAEVTALAARVDEVRALERAGQYHRALDLAVTLADEARATGYAPLEAEAVLLVGVLQKQLSDNRAAEANLREAWRAAARAHDDVRTVIALTELLELVGHAMSRHAEGLSLLDAADAAVLRAGDTPVLRARLLSRAAEVLQEAGRKDDALAAAERAVALWQKAGPNSLDLAHALQSHARILGGLELFEQAQHHAEIALGIHEQQLGSEHPEVARSCKYIGDFLMMRGRYTEARPYYERAVAIAERSIGHESREIIGMYNGLGVVFERQGHSEEALRYYRDAIAIGERLRPGMNFSLSINMAESLRTLGRTGEAREACEQAQSLLEKNMAIGRGYGGNLPDALQCIARLLSDDHRYGEAIPLLQRALSLHQGSDVDTPSHAAILVDLGQAYLATGRAREALPLLMRAVEVYDSTEHDAGEVGDACFALARALVATGGQRQRAVALASRARDRYAEAAKSKEADLARVAAWLADNGR